MTKLLFKNTNILAVLGLQFAPLSLNAEIIETAASLVEDRASVRILETLSADGQGAFMHALEKNDDDEALSVLKKNDINLENVLSEEIERMKKEITALAEEVEDRTVYTVL